MKSRRKQKKILDNQGQPNKHRINRVPQAPPLLPNTENKTARI
jgi:hypothetical protein